MKRNILVFDSGIGGISVLQALYKYLPDCSYCYAADTALLPYGEKSDALLKKRIVPLFNAFLKQYPADIAVIACNTASTLLLDILRDNFDIPFVGVVPAIKPAALQTQSQHVALLATPATVNREYIDKLHQDHASACEIKRIASSKLVGLAEKKILFKENIDTAVQQHIQQLDTGSSEIDTVILGCTHFPLLKDELEKYWPHPVKWLDSSDAIARRTQHLLESTASSEVRLNAQLITTNNENTETMMQALLPFGIKQHQSIEINSQ